jgi:hypothetical protein
MKTEGGHKRGHSNMTHWDHTEEIKRQTKKARREVDKEECDLVERVREIANSGRLIEVV